MVLSDGAKLYRENCASCHGAKLEGQPNWRSRNPDGTLPAPPHDDTGHTWHHSDPFLFAYTKYGGAELMRRMGLRDIKSGMPGFGETLTDREIIAILDYIKSTWSERSRNFQARRTQKEREGRRR